MTRRSNRTSLARKRGRELEYLLYFSASPEPLDASPVWADSRAHRATDVGSDLGEQPGHGGSGGQQARTGRRSSISHRRHGRLESVRLAQRRRNGSISEIPVEG